MRHFCQLAQVAIIVGERQSHMGPAFGNHNTFHSVRKASLAPFYAVSCICAVNLNLDLSIFCIAAFFILIFYFLFFLVRARLISCSLGLGY